MVTSWRQRYLQVGLVLVFILLIRFYPFFVLDRAPYFGDNFSLQVPSRVFTAQWLRQGTLPTWNPYIFSGLPWLSDVSNSIIYPSTVWFVWLSPAAALNVTLMMHLAIAMLGMYGLSYRWTRHHWASLVAAVLWTLSTHVTGSLNNLATAQSIVWLPWLAWTALDIGRKSWAPLAFATTVLLQLLGGYPLHSFYGIGLAVLMSLHVSWGQIPLRKWLKSWLITGVITLGLTAIVWVPFSRLMVASTRMQQSLTQAASGSLNPAMLIKPLLPYFFDKPTAGMKWGPAWSGQPNAVFYVTWVGLLAIGSTIWPVIQSLVKYLKSQHLTKKGFLKWLHQPGIKDPSFFAILTVITLVLALGSYLPGYSWLQEAVPFFRISRYPSMVMMITNLVLCLWVAVGLTSLRLKRQWLPWLSYGGVGLVVMGLSGMVVVRTQFASIWSQFDGLIGGKLSASRFHTMERDRVIAEVISSDLALVAGLAVVALWAISRQKWSILVIAITLDMLFQTQAQLFFTSSQVYPTADQVSRQLTHTSQAPFTQLFSPQGRVLTRNSNQPYTDYGSYWEAMVVRAPFSDSFVDRFELITGQHAQRLRDGLTPDWNMVYQVPTVHGYTTLLPQDYAAIWQTQPEVGINFIEPVELDNSALAQWAVKYYVVDNWFNVEEDLSSLPVVAEHQTWTVYELPALARFRDELDRPIELTHLAETPNRLELVFSNSPIATTLRVADRYDDEWRAIVNGQEVTIENYQGMRQIPIQPGDNHVLFQYHPRRWFMGAALTLITAAVAGLGTWWVSRRPSLSRRSAKN